MFADIRLPLVEGNRQKDDFGTRPIKFGSLPPRQVTLALCIKFFVFVFTFIMVPEVFSPLTQNKDGKLLK